MGFKICSKCNKLKKYSEFYKNKSNKDGFSYYCRECQKKIVNKSKKNSKSKKNEIESVKINNKNIELKMIEGQVYADANSMTNVETLKNWKRSPNTERYIKALNGVKTTQLIKTTEGRNGGTWIHEKLILSLARYVSVEFEIWCDERIAEFIKNNNSNPIIPKSYKEALTELLVQLESNEKLQIENKSMKPKAEFYDEVIESNDTIDIGQLAKTINKGIGRNKLFEFLRENKILDKRNIPYQIFVDKGYFRTIETTYTQGGNTKIYIKTVVYQKGVDFILGYFKEDKEV